MTAPNALDALRELATKWQREPDYQDKMPLSGEARCLLYGMQKCSKELLAELDKLAQHVLASEAAALVDALEVRRDEVLDLLKKWDFDSHYTLSRFIEELAALASPSQSKEEK